MAAPPTSRLQPPAIQQPLDTLGNHTLPWASYHQDVADEIARLARMRHGVTDGSDATAGDIGEYLSATGSGVGLTSGAVASIATLPLTAGDWDVAGNVVFAATGATTNIAAGINAGAPIFGVIRAQISGTLGTGAQHQHIGTGGPVRVNVTGTTDVFLVVVAAWTGGSGVTADGVIWARRAR